MMRLTPAGRGAVAVILLAGQDALRVFLKHWQGKTPVRQRPVFGRLQLSALNSEDKDLYEEAVAHLTQENAVELHVHGGEQVLTAVETLFSQYGAVPVNRLNKPVPPLTPQALQRETALRLLPFAPTERTAQILLDQYHGAWDGTWNPKTEERAFLGKHLVEPFRAVLAGASNAGKSSLLNAVLGFQRCLVHSEPGTTRDTVCVHTAIEGFPVAFVDTAGFRETADDLERLGIERSRQSCRQADLIVWVVDPTVPESMRPVCPVSNPAESNILICCNKKDLAVDPKIDLAVSALTGEGIETLLNAVIRRLVPHPPSPGEAVPLISDEQCR
ncbi:MAG: 50S ribosome-binding GTPase [Planctomycetaceae bacterium]|nr:50S ribosome-binding GTPase [Planctomycetaceae bacterium]